MCPYTHSKAYFYVKVLDSRFRGNDGFVRGNDGFVRGSPSCGPGPPLACG